MKILHCLTLAIIGWYLLIITVHYSNPRPLWNDEYCVFANIDHKPLLGIFQHGLSHDQEFPRVYLLAIGLLAQAFSYDLLSLRFLPFICMMSAFFIWVYLAKKQIRSSMGLFTFFLCWVASAPLIYYAAELKQYSMDVLTAAIFLLFLFHQKDIQQKMKGPGYALFLIALGFLGCLSYSVFFFMPLVLYNLLRDAKKDRGLWPFVGCYVAGFIGCILFVYTVDFRLSDANLMQIYWKEYFIDFNSPGDFFRSFGEGMNNLVSRWFVEKPKWLRIPARIFVGFGLLRLLWTAWGVFKKDGSRFVSIGSITAFVLLELFILSACKKIPFAVPRISLFLAPMLLFATVDALEWLKARNRWGYRIGQGVFVLYLSYVSLGIIGVILKGDLGGAPIIWQ